MKRLTHASFVGISIVTLALVFPAWPRESAERFYPFSGLTDVVVSPNGRWIAASAEHGDESVVLVQQPGLAGLVTVVRADWVRRVTWESPDTLFVEAGSDAGRRQLVFASLRTESGEIQVEMRKSYAPGWLIDSLPLVEDSLLWEFEHNGRTSLNRVTVQDLVEYNARTRITALDVHLGERVDFVTGATANRGWILDRKLNPRAVIRRDPEGFSILMPDRGKGPLVEVYRFKDSEPERELFPVALNSDETRLIVRAYNGNDTRGLFELDPRTMKIGDEVFVHPDFDVEAILIDPLTRELTGAAYRASGETRYHYFEQYRDRFLAKLPDEWRGDEVWILNGAADRQVFAFRASNARNPGDYYIRARSGTIHRIGRYGENVDRDSLVAVDSFRVKSRDGTEVEAFLTLPRDKSHPVPLVVMPHGGPQDVADDRHYDAFLQYLANWGFAVLQVNYRGSSGYGLKFSQLGRKEWARGIEDDIDAAVEHAMALPAVDESRLCIVGGSYGGFSALASVIRHRARYRCAVSINGVADVPLLYDSSDMADSKSVMAFYQEFVGDLETEREKLIEVSPAYHVDALAVPILIIYGTADRRVDPDHAHRMLLMLELYGRAHQSLEIEGAQHWLTRDEGVIHARTIRRFLTEHLLPGADFQPDPVTPYDR